MKTSTFELGLRLSSSDSRLGLTVLYVKSVNFGLKRRHKDKKFNTVYACRVELSVSVLIRPEC